VVERSGGNGLDRDTTARLEGLIGRMAGVIAAKVIADSTGKPVEIHVLTNLDRSPKQVARDVQSCAASACGMQIDHRIISIAQVRDDSIGESGLRLRIKGFSVSVDENSIVIKVNLAYKASVYEGMATGMSKTQGKFATASLACVNSLHKFLGSDFVFSVVDVQKTKIAGMEAYNVVLNHIYEGRQTLLTGVSLVQDDEYMAVIKATLQCINRVLFKAWRDNKQSPSETGIDL
jgi:hypothetical protein